MVLTDFFSDADSDRESDEFELTESDTLWQDEIKSMVRIGNFRVTTKTRVNRIEYVEGTASIWPIPQTPTAFVVDLSDPQYDLVDPTTEERYTLDRLIRNADNDAWESTSGTGSSTAMVTFVPGEPPIECRRAWSRCRGAFACENLDSSLRKVVRFELDPASRTAVLAAQAETRRGEGMTPEQQVALKMYVIVLLLIKLNFPQVSAIQGSSRGHRYYIGCSDATPGSKENHARIQIPDYVDEKMLTKALANRPLSNDPAKDTQDCSRIVHPTTGLRQRYCPHAHIKNGKKIRSLIKRYPCDAKRSIYVPTDSSILKVLIVNNNTGHNHPMPTLKKASLSVKQKYRQCVTAIGCVGATVSKVDNAASTSLILDGKTPSFFSPALQSKRVKQALVHEVKGEKFPHGLDELGIKCISFKLTKPLPERYIHAYLTTEDGGICIITFVPYLLKLLDDPGVTSFDDDTTYKRVKGKMNEWELSIFVQIVLRAASVVRAYINRASADFFEQLFDELQRVKLQVTGKPMPLKRFVPGGNLLVMNSDMDGAQILGICRSVMKHNDPVYSGIPNDTPPEQIAGEFVKICWRHAKDPVNDFRALVSEEDFQELLNFAYLDSKEALDKFSVLCGHGLNRRSFRLIIDWWDHKGMHVWIFPCLIQSQSKIPRDVWNTTPSTTNTNEAQHHWTNKLTGIGLSLVEAIESARKVDEGVAEDFELSLRTGVLANPHNEVVNRMSRNTQRQSSSARKSQEARDSANLTKQIRDEMAVEAESRRISNTRTKGLQAQLKAMKGGSKHTKAAPSILLTASSSGRVKSATGKFDFLHNRPEI
ncbi:hypothetical protein C8R43DRAFT_868399 [Mycena crocata]|nr:hypothetical protein C8R43DRAFT_868399 [Mycena crocata]